MVEPYIGSEERTEPMTEAEREEYFQSVRTELPVHDETIPLDLLQLEEHHHRQNIRLLVRPLTTLHNNRAVSPGAEDNCQWVALRAEVASTDQPGYKVLAVTQTSKDIKFSVRIPETPEESARPPLWCELYYDPASDKIVFWNKSDVPISLTRVSPSQSPSPSAEENRTMVPGIARSLRPGTWRIKVHQIAVLDFRILEKRPVTIYQPFRAQVEHETSVSGSDQTNTSMKRSRDDEDDEKRVKRRASDNTPGLDDGAIMFLRPGGDDSDSLVFPVPNARETRALAPATGHALLDSVEGETVAVTGVCELDEYQLTKQDPIANTALSAVYTATHSDVPDDIVTVKVLKTRIPNPGEKPHVHERNVIRQADMWMRECQSQEDLRHGSIVKYYGGDARFLSLYMEHVDAQDLTAAPRWRNTTSEEFQGSKHDSVRILHDISEALSYLHGRELIHNDIKPANILYSPDRGAVLCDFGLSTKADKAPSGGGTPYYVPPEFIGAKVRGPASDVWALGVTMLYVMRKIPFPDSRARRRHPKPLYWQIAGINNPSLPHRQYGNGQSAISQMRDWLAEIFDARERLNSRDRLERIVIDMLTPNPARRITMAEVVRELGRGQTQGPV